MTDEFIYTPATTDVTIRWRKLYGWLPPSENPAYQQKWATFRAQMARGAESLGVQPQPQFVKPRLINTGKVSNYD